MKHGIRTAAKRQTEVCRSPEVLTKGDFARWRSIPIGTAIRFRLRYSEIGFAENKPFHHQHNISRLSAVKTHSLCQFSNYLKLVFLWVFDTICA